MKNQAIWLKKERTPQKNVQLMKYDFVVPMKSPNLTCSAAGVQSGSVLPRLVPNVVIGTENVVTHALPDLSREKKQIAPLFLLFFPPPFFLQTG